jgi:pilus assembly protein FimV
VASTGATAAAPDKAAPVAPVPATVAKPPVVAPVAPVIPAAPAPVETSFIDDLIGSDLAKPLAGTLIAGLLGGALFFNNKRKKRKLAEAAEDDLLHEVNDEKSFFYNTSNEPAMAQGIPVVETEFHDAPATVAMPAAHKIANPEFNDIAPPKVNAHKTVDPLTEANVYLDYGRDEQAEEILKDGLKTQPGNTAIYSKLLGIYAKRRDAKNFEHMAMRVKPLFMETDAQWLAISKQGLDLAPGNPLYKAAAAPVENYVNPVNSTEFAASTVAQLDPVSAKSPASLDLDLDLDFNFASGFPDAIPAKKMEPNKSPLVDFPDFSLAPVKAVAPAAIATTAALGATALLATPAEHMTSSAAKPIELDLGHLSLDLNGSSGTSKANAERVTDKQNNGPLETKLETKLALAQEFRAIGDTTGAKMLANEVLALATGSLKTRAEALLAEIG